MPGTVNVCVPPGPVCVMVTSCVLLSAYVWTASTVPSPQSITCVNDSCSVSVIVGGAGAFKFAVLSKPGSLNATLIVVKPSDDTWVPTTFAPPGCGTNDGAMLFTTTVNVVSTKSPPLFVPIPTPAPLANFDVSANAPMLSSASRTVTV